MTKGTRVRCNCPGSRFHGQLGVIQRVNVTSSDHFIPRNSGRTCASFVGHQVKFPGAQAIIEPQHLEESDPVTEAREAARLKRTLP